MLGSARPLKKSEIDQAYALAQLAIAPLDPARWRAFVRATMDDGQAKHAGVLVFEGADQRFLGLLVYSLQSTLRYGRQMIVDPLVPVGISSRQTDDVAKALIVAAEAIARTEGCRDLVVVAGSRQAVPVWGGRAEALGDLGFTPESETLYCRRLD